MMQIFHGSPDVISRPEFGKGKPYNDYGMGFYCTKNLELAQEWACDESNSGFANIYSLDTSGLVRINLNTKKYHILNWLAILLENRNFDLIEGLPSEARAYILREFLPDYKGADILVGYRADDSYFSFAKAFLNGTISLEQLSRAMRLGQLGEQIVIKSQRAFDRLDYQGVVFADKAVFYPKRAGRDSTAREDFRKMLSEGYHNGHYILDILREQWKNDNDSLIR